MGTPRRTARWAAIVWATCLWTQAQQAPPKGLNPLVQKIVREISESRISATMKKLETFGTRNIFSAQDDPERGIGAARNWIHKELSSYSPRLQVRFDSYRVKKQKRVFRDVEISNVIAELPGTIHRDRHLIIAGHYDSLNLIRKPKANGSEESDEPGDIDEEKSAAAPQAPGVADDASGTAAVMEIARVMSQYEFGYTVTFIAFAGEEEGLVGSSLYAAKAHKENQVIDAVFNNDIIGSDVAGNGRKNNGSIRVFSEHPNDSPSRQLARYIKEIGERYVPAMGVELIFRHDRMDRGGDHTPFNREGYAAVRFTTPSEDYGNQHSGKDTFDNSSPSYATQVTRVNAAALASLALAPKAPEVTRVVKTGTMKGKRVPNMSRGRSHYDAVLRWTNDNPEPDLAGYLVVMRATTSPFWEREVWAGNVNEFVIPGVSIDEYVFGVKAVDKDGNESLVSAYIEPIRPLQPIEVY